MIDRLVNLRGRRLQPWAVLGLILATSVVGVACKTVAPRPPKVTRPQPERALVLAPGVGQAAGAPAYDLTASDGTRLRLATVQVRTVVQGPLALTQLRLGFDNPAARTIEGRFTVTMPEGAAISRFAMKIGDKWQEGEVVERRTATRVYESYLHRRIDPALLEHDAGNRFRARVFPIFAGERKELILGYRRSSPTRPRPIGSRFRACRGSTCSTCECWCPVGGEGAADVLTSDDPVMPPG